MLNINHLILLNFLIVIILITFQHSSFLLISILIILIIIFSEDLLQKKIITKLRNVLFISFASSFSYFLYHYFLYNEYLWNYLFVFNLRVANIFLISTIAINNISIYDLINSQNYVIFLSLIFSSIQRYEKIVIEYLEIIKSRNFYKENYKKNIYYYSFLIIILYRKYYEDMTEIKEILESKGIFFNEYNH